jgi:hypothetical protein
MLMHASFESFVIYSTLGNFCVNYHCTIPVSSGTEVLFNIMVKNLNIKVKVLLIMSTKVAFRSAACQTNLIFGQSVLRKKS